MNETKKVYTHKIQTIEGVRHSGYTDAYVASANCQYLNNEAEKLNIKTRYEVALDS